MSSRAICATIGAEGANGDANKPVGLGTGSGASVRGAWRSRSRTQLCHPSGSLSAWPLYDLTVVCRPSAPHCGDTGEATSCMEERPQFLPGLCGRLRDYLVNSSAPGPRALAV